MIRFSRPPDRPRASCLPKAGGPDGGAGLWRRCSPLCMPCSGGLTWAIARMHHKGGGTLRAGNHAETLPSRLSRPGPRFGETQVVASCKPRRAQSPQAVQRSRKLPVGCGHHPASFGSARECATPCMSLTCTPLPIQRRRPRAALRTPACFNLRRHRARRVLACQSKSDPIATAQPSGLEHRHWDRQRHASCRMRNGG